MRCAPHTVLRTAAGRPRLRFGPFARGSAVVVLADGLATGPTPGRPLYALLPDVPAAAEPDPPRTPPFRSGRRRGRDGCRRAPVGQPGPGRATAAPHGSRRTRTAAAAVE